MSLARLAKKRDSNEGPIIEAIEKAGWHVWQLDKPADLLCFKEGRGFQCLEVKNQSTAIAPYQHAFAKLTGTAIVRTPLAALEALGEYNPRSAA